MMMNFLKSIGKEWGFLDIKSEMKYKNKIGIILKNKLNEK